MRAANSPENITFIVLVGNSTTTPVELMLAQACRAIARDNIEKVLGLDVCGQVIVATDSPDFAAELETRPVIVELDSNDAGAEPFHFGRRLRSLIGKYDAQNVFYIGGGSAPLLSADDIERISHDLLAQDGDLVITNNFYSTDFAAFKPGRAVDHIEPPDTDNNLTFLLHHQAGLRYQSLPQTAATVMDVDTPTDLLLLKLQSNLGRHAREVLSKLELDVDNFDIVLDVMNDDYGQLIVAGRVGATAMAHLERNTACRTRVFSEERGMRAAGRQGGGQVKSLLGAYLEIVGPTKFFAKLAEMGDAALIDTRVIFEHFGLHLTPADRFNSDLLRAEEIANPFVREFTAAARRSSIPVVLGGHSVVAGGIWVLVETARARSQRPLTSANGAGDGSNRITSAESARG